MRLSTILFACFVVIGCASTESVWVKDGSTQEDFNVDAGQCKAQAFSAPGMPMMQVAIIYSSCMQGKGWHREERPIAR